MAQYTAVSVPRETGDRHAEYPKRQETGVWSTLRDRRQACAASLLGPDSWSKADPSKL